MGATDQLGYNGFRTKGTTLQWRSSVLPKPVMCLSKLSRLANGWGWVVRFVSYLVNNPEDRFTCASPSYYLHFAEQGGDFLGHYTVLNTSCNREWFYIDTEL